MNIKFLFPMLVILLLTVPFFALDAIADTESTTDELIIVCSVSGILVLVFISVILARERRYRPFLKAHESLLASDDPKVLLELVEKCNEYRQGRDIPEVSSLARQAKDKATKIQQAERERERIQREERERIQREQANLETFKSEISEDRSHPAVVATLKENMHNPDSFQHVSSEYETVEQEGERYQKIVMTFRGTNTFNALVLQTCYFLVDADNQISLVGSADDSESSPVNIAALTASVDAAANAIEGIATAADLLLFFTSNEE